MEKWKYRSQFNVNSASIENPPKRIDMYVLVISVSLLYDSLDQNIVDIITTGWIIVTAVRSKQDKTKIVK